MGGDLEIKLARYNRVYQPGEVIQGEAHITTKGGLSHNGINLKAEGLVQQQLSANSVGLLEAFSSSLKPYILLTQAKQVQPPGKLGDGKIAVPFELKLESTGTKPLLDTYHGIYLCVQYTLTVEVLKSGMFGQTYTETTEFIVEVPLSEKAAPKATSAPFTLTSDNVKKARGKKDPNQFFSLQGLRTSGAMESIWGQQKLMILPGSIENVNCPVTDALKGSFMVKNTSHPLKSVSLQLIRVESINSQEGTMKEASEIQNTQLAVGNVAKGLEIPIHVVFPRLFTSPSISTPGFQLDFEANLVFEFENGYSPLENIPLKLHR